MTRTVVCENQYNARVKVSKYTQKLPWDWQEGSLKSESRTTVMSRRSISPVKNISTICAARQVLAVFFLSAFRCHSYIISASAKVEMIISACSFGHLQDKRICADLFYTACLHQWYRNIDLCVYQIAAVVKELTKTPWQRHWWMPAPATRADSYDRTRRVIFQQFFHRWHLPQVLHGSMSRVTVSAVDRASSKAKS